MLCLPWAVFILLMLVEPSKCLKQIVLMKLNRVKNLNWLEVNQLAFYKHGRGFELGNTESKSSQRSGRGLYLGPQCCDRLAMLTPPDHGQHFSQRLTSVNCKFRNVYQEGLPQCRNLGTFSLFCTFCFSRFFIVMTYLFSQFYVTGELNRFLHRG